MRKINNIINFYVLTNTLKDKIRSGVELWNISKERLESVAEHVYGVCMLEFARYAKANKITNKLVIYDRIPEFISMCKKCCKNQNDNI